jgi:hypothetical protein
MIAGMPDPISGRSGKLQVRDQAGKETVQREVDLLTAGSIDFVTRDANGGMRW